MNHNNLSFFILRTNNFFNLLYSTYDFYHIRFRIESYLSLKIKSYLSLKINYP